MKLSLKKKIIAGSCFPLILMVGLGWIAVDNIRSLLESNRWVERTQSIMTEADALVAAATNMESGARGYLLAGEDAYLEPYHQGQEAFAATLTALKDQVSDRPAQVELLSSVEETIKQWQSNAMEPAIALRREIGHAKTMDDMADLVAQDRGRVYFDEFRSQIQTFIKNEQDVMEARDKDAKKATSDNVTHNTLITKTTKWITQTHEVIAKAKEIEGTVVAMENSARGYLLSGKEEILEPYHQDSQAFVDRIGALSEKVVKDNPFQAMTLKKAKQSISQWQETVIEPAIALRNSVAAGDKTMDDIVALAGEGLGQEHVDAFRKQLSTFIQREEELLGQRLTDVANATGARDENDRLLTQTTQWLNQTYDVIKRAEKIFTTALDMETSMRGYLLAGKEQYLEPYRQGQTDIEAQIDALAEIVVKDNPFQVVLLKKVKKKIQAWQEDVAEDAISLRRAIGDAKTMNDMAALIREAKGKVFFDAFSDQITQFIDTEGILMAERKAKAVETANQTITRIMGGTVVTVVLAFILSLVVARIVVKPVVQAVNRVKDIAEGEGDLTKTLDSSRSDELGEMAGWFNLFMEKLQKVIKEVVQNADTLGHASDTLMKTATNLTNGAKQMGDEAEAVAHSAESMSTNMDSVSSTTEEMTVSITSVADSIGEMTSSISEVAENAAKAATVVQRASSLTVDSNQKLEQLRSAADEIGKVVVVIKDIADQTDLLALNATIEAARAGEAGKGFAVVAAEVKDLANQTAGAISDVSERISAIQESASESIDALSGISNVISEIENTSQVIAAAVEQQNVTTQAISANISQVATGSGNMSKGIHESAQVSKQITENIQTVNSAAQQSAQEALQTKAAGEEMSELAEALNRLVGQFKV